MAPDTHNLVFEKTVNASMAQVFHAFTNSTMLRQWFCDAAMTEPKTDGRYYCRWNAGFYASGHFLSYHPDESFSLFWYGRDEPAPTIVTLALTSQGDSTLVHIEQQGVGAGPAWEKTIEEMKKGWTASLENLTSVLEKGEDLRFTRRPMLGITISDFTPEIAAHLGVPVKQGIRIDGTVEGMGARDAGLVGDDVVVKMDGKEVVDWGSLAAALQTHSAGETIEVVFYRGPEQKTTQMTLSGRPLPPMPSTIKALAEIVRNRVVTSQDELEKFLETITEEEASKRPAPEEWNVKEVIAHLIQGERGYQNWVGELVSGQEPHYDDWGGNLNARVEATVAAYPTLEDLNLEFIRAGEETAALFERLPASIVDQKASFWRISYGEVEGPNHLRAHLAQMKAAVEATKK